MDDIGIDFAIVSWFGANTGNPVYEFRNRAAKVLFATANKYSKKVRLSIMVEPFNETLGGYNYNQIYDYVYENFVQPFPSAIRILSDSSSESIPWVWRVNGAMSVLGSILATIGRILLGFSLVMLFGMIAYLVAFLCAFVWMKHGTRLFY